MLFCSAFKLTDQTPLSLCPRVILADIRGVCDENFRDLLRRHNHRRGHSGAVLIADCSHSIAGERSCPDGWHESETDTNACVEDGWHSVGDYSCRDGWHASEIGAGGCVQDGFHAVDNIHTCRDGWHGIGDNK